MKIYQTHTKNEKFNMWRVVKVRFQLPRPALYSLKISPSIIIPNNHQNATFALLIFFQRLYYN